MSNNKDFKIKNGIKSTVYHEGLGTVVSGAEGYYLSGASYDGKSFSVGSQEIYPNGLAFKSDGTKMYVSGPQGNDVNEYALSTAWDVSTASYTTVFSTSGQTGSPQDIFFKTDGTKMYVLDTVTQGVFQYSLSTAWDISTASYDSVSFGTSGQDTSPRGMYIKPDGTKLYVVGSQNDTVSEYNLSSAWDMSTALYSQNYSISSEEVIPLGLGFAYDGTKFFVVGNENRTVYQYSLSTAWDVSTASYSNKSFSIAGQDTGAYSIRFKPDGTKMYIGGADNTSVFQYSTVLTTAELDLSTGNVFEITPTSDIQVSLTNPAASGTSSGATLLLSGAATTSYDLANAVYDSVSLDVSSENGDARAIAFNDDGTKLYMVGSSAIPVADSVFQYSLSTAYDLSTSSYDSISFSVGSQEATPLVISFNNDGTKMYTAGVNSTVYQYSLSTAYDISTASYNSVSFSVSSQETLPVDVSFNNDGTKMYVLGYNTDAIYQYTLSSAFIVSSASYDSVSFSVTSQVSLPQGFVLTEGGTKMYITDNTTDSVYQYSLSTAYDISTASYDSVSFSVASQDINPSGIRFNDTGTKFYICGFVNSTIYQYSSATPATITYDPDLQWSGGTAPTSPAIGETDVLTFNTTDGGTTYKSALAIDGAK
jgi:DNA-binding beta-propeller fold protein YncE